MNQHIVGILGLGVFGQTIALELGKYGTEVIAIDQIEKNVNKIANHVTKAVVGDFTDETLLEDIGIPNCDIVIIATGDNLESSVLATMYCRRMGIETIIGKAKQAIYEEVLYEIGVDEVISPERESGYELASKILRNHIEEVFRLDDNLSLVEFIVPNPWIGRTVLELDLRKKYDINLIGMRTDRGEPIQAVDIDRPLPERMILVGVANAHIFERYDYLNLLK